MWPPGHRMQAESRLVLIVERDLQVRELQEYFLGRAGFKVAFADDGEAGLEEARLRLPRVVVTEILIPKLDGLALCRHLREDPRTHRIPVIIFSILAAGVRASEAGAHAFLRKPLVETVFLDAINSAIGEQPLARMEQT
jgi:CheY-like chemotaxis protein